jgi:hypothetical protein
MSPTSTIKFLKFGHKGLVEAFGETLVNCSNRLYKDLFTLIFSHDPIPALWALRSLLEIFSDHDGTFFDRFNIVNIFSFFRNTVKLEPIEFVTRCKYFSTYPLATVMKNEVEEVDFDPYIFDGKIRRYLKTRYRSNKFSSKTLRLCWTLLQGFKRGCNSVDDSFVEESYRKHQKLLSSDPPEVDPGFDQRFCEKIPVIFKHFRHKLEIGDEISRSACFENSKSKGGSLAYLLRDRHDIIDYFPRSFPTLCRRYNFDHKELLCMYDWKCKTYEVRGVPGIDLFYLKSMIDSRPFQPVKVSPVLEPLKVRLVTKGVAANYYYSKSLQKSMWSFLKKKFPFIPIGTPLSTDLIYQLLDKSSAVEDKYNCCFNEFVSGDYSSATDRISIRHTKYVFEEVLKYVSESDRDLYRSVLYEQDIYYPDNIVDSFLQKNGQLMGSILSFPVLCVINLITYWLSLERLVGHPVSFNSLPVLINGDDILFRSNPCLSSIWERYTKKVGLVLSVGKNYIHKSNFTMNSQLFRYVSDKIIEVPFFNVGLLLGQGKSGMKESTGSIADWYNKVLAGASNKLRAHNRFLYYNKSRLPPSWFGQYFLPINLGGLGFNLYPEVKPYVNFTRYQRCVVNYLINRTHQGEDKLPLGYVTRGGSPCVTRHHTYSQRCYLSPYSVLNKGQFYFETDSKPILNSKLPVTEKPIFIPFRLNIKNKPIVHEDLDFFQIPYRVVCTIL